MSSLYRHCNNGTRKTATKVVIPYVRCILERGRELVQVKKILFFSLFIKNCIIYIAGQLEHVKRSPELR